MNSSGSYLLKYFEELPSTNTWLLQQLAQGVDFADETVVWTMRQTAGRGQVGNGWEAEPGKNVSFSVLLKPTFIAPRDQFVLSEMTALSVADVIPDSVIKWPNDIYVGDEKICGMLIENRLQGMALAHSVLGIGINVNQEHWVGNAPNPTSIKLVSGQERDPKTVMEEVLDHIHRRYQALQMDPLGIGQLIHSQFCQRLYRSAGLHPYVDAQTGESFSARIKTVDRMGPLHLELEDGEERVYSFKEVKFVLPCGVTKE